MGGAENWEEVVVMRKAIASSITVRVCDRSVDVSVKILEGVGRDACAGGVLNIGAASAVLGTLDEPGACVWGMGLRPGIVVLERGASRSGNGCIFDAGGSTENRPVSPSTNASLLFCDICARSRPYFQIPSAKSS